MQFIKGLSEYAQKVTSLPELKQSSRILLDQLIDNNCFAVLGKKNNILPRKKRLFSMLTETIEIDYGTS